MGYSSIYYAHYTPLAYPLPNPLAMGYIPTSVHVHIWVSVMRIFKYLLCGYKGICYARTIQTLPKHYTNRLKPLDSLSEPITALE